MKHTFFLLNLFFLTCICFRAEAQTATQPAGAGTITAPYLIGSLANLRWIATSNYVAGWSSGKYFKQIANINADSTSNSAIWARGWVPIGGYTIVSGNLVAYEYSANIYAFLGVYDGGNFEISNLRINTSLRALSASNGNTSAINAGLFGVVGLLNNSTLAIISNVRLTNVSITATFQKVGALVGQLYSGRVINCSSSGSISVSQSTIGGLVGQCQSGGLIMASFSTCSLTQTAGSQVGVLLGLNQGTVIECYTKGTASGLAGVGGLTGSNQTSTISSSYANSSVSLLSGTSTEIGGLTGVHTSGTINSSVYWNESLNTKGVGRLAIGSDLSTGQTSTALQNISTFPTTSWDFSGATNDGSRDLWSFGIDGFPTVSVPSNNWEGDVSSGWATVGNWSKNAVPTSTLFDTTSTNLVNIPASLSTYPTLSANTSLAYLTLASSTSLNLSTFNLTLSGNLTNNGTISGSGILSLSGSTAQIVSGTGSVKHITVNNAAGVTVTSGSNKLNVLGVLTPTAGTITTNGNLVLKSTATEEGTIGTVATCPTNPFTGDVTVERFIPAGNRAYRFLTPGVTTSTTINANWQEGATSSTDNPVPGYGTHITGSTSGANGLDATLSGSASLYMFDNAAQTQSAVISTSGNTLKAGQAYQLVVRGSRAIDLTAQTTPTPDNTVIRTTGVLSVCDVSFTANTTVPLSNSATGWSFFGNPYWSVVDWSSVEKSGVEDIYYYWDPTLGTQGAYAALTINGIGIEGIKSNFESDVSIYLQPGQGFFVKNTSATPVITFKESNKVTSSASKKLIFQKNPVGAGGELGEMDNARVRGNSSTKTEKVYLSLFHQDKLDKKSSDGFALAYNSRYSDVKGPEDADKFSNPGENISAFYNSTRFSILGMQTNGPVNSDTIPIAMWNLGDRDYVLRFNLTQDVDAQREIFLLNKTTGQTIRVDNPGTFDYTFRPALGVRTKNDLAIVFNTTRIAPKPRSRKDLVVFPNPTSDGVVQMSIPNTTGKLILSQTAQAELFDGSGKMVMKADVQMSGSGMGQLDLGELASGSYVVKVSVGGKVFMAKLIKQ